MLPASMNYTYVIFFLPSRTQSEPSGHVWREVQTLQGNQVHDQSWEVPSSNLKGEFCKGNSHEHFFLSYLSKSKKISLSPRSSPFWTHPLPFFLSLQCLGLIKGEKGRQGGWDRTETQSAPTQFSKRSCVMEARDT